MKSYINYEDTCTLYNTDKGKTINADIVEFRYQEKMVCNIQNGIEIRLNYNSKHDEYVGSMAGLEFTTKGPRVGKY